MRASRAALPVLATLLLSTPPAAPGAVVTAAALPTAAAPGRAPEPAAERLAGLEPDQRERLWAGGTVVVIEEPASGPPAAGRALRILDAPAERLFRAVADVGHYAEFFPFVSRSRAEVGADGRLLVHQVVDLPFPWPDRRFAATVESSRPGRGAAAVWSAGWRHVPGSGNVRENRGRWTLLPLAPGRTLVELRLESDAGGVPRSLQRRALADTLPWALDGLRQQVNRCRYDEPVHPTCGEAPALAPPPATDGAAGAGLRRQGETGGR